MKKKILILIDWFLPGYKAGGQIPSVANIAKLFKNEYDISIMTRNKDWGKEADYEGLEFDRWILKYDTRIMYISRSKLNFGFLKKTMKKEHFDILYLNSFFSFYFSILPIIIKKLCIRKGKILLAPRGMLGEGALKIKGFKKKAYIAFAKVIGIYKNIFWHASSSFENEEIKTVFGEKAVVFNALDITILDFNRFQKIEKKAGTLNLFFVSRITHKKNLDFALDILMEMNAGNISYNIIGPIENVEYWELCMSKINQLNKNITINYLGSVPNFQLKDLSRSFDFFFLPTLNENYGHSIIEALSFGCPVIISDQTPWNSVNDKNAGWAISLNDKQKFIDTLNFALSMDNNTFVSWSEAAIKFAETNCNIEMVMQENRTMIESI